MKKWRHFNGSPPPSRHRRVLSATCTSDLPAWIANEHCREDKNLGHWIDCHLASIQTGETMQLFTKKRVLVAGSLPVAGAATFAYAKRGHEAKTPPLKYRASVVDTGSIAHGFIRHAGRRACCRWTACDMSRSPPMPVGDRPIVLKNPDSLPAGQTERSVDCPEPRLLKERALTPSST
jgi:hypothetical protein